MLSTSSSMPCSAAGRTKRFLPGVGGRSSKGSGRGPESWLMDCFSGNGRATAKGRTRRKENASSSRPDCAARDPKSATDVEYSGRGGGVTSSPTGPAVRRRTTAPHDAVIIVQGFRLRLCS